MPAVIRFLGYNPLPPAAESVGDRLIWQRTKLGLTQRVAASRLDVDPCTLAKWERGERVPTGTFAARVEAFLRTDEMSLAEACCAR